MGVVGTPNFVTLVNIFMLEFWHIGRGSKMQIIAYFLNQMDQGKGMVCVPLGSNRTRELNKDERMTI
jgi:hypothetical protein